MHKLFFDKNFTAKQTEHYADGKPKYEVNVKKGKKEGLETFWYASGNKYIQTNYVNDKEDGVWNQWYENGQLKLEANYKEGREHGSFTQWYDNGQKRVEANFVNGIKEGVETAWNKDGSVKYTSVKQRAILSRLGVETASNSFHLSMSLSSVLAGDFWSDLYGHDL